MLSSRLSLTSASLSWLSNFNTTSISKREGLLPAFFGLSGMVLILAQWIKQLSGNAWFWITFAGIVAMHCVGGCNAVRDRFYDVFGYNKFVFGGTY